MDKFKLIGSFLLLVIVRIVAFCLILTVSLLFLPVLLFLREKTVNEVIWNMYELIKG